MPFKLRYLQFCRSSFCLLLCLLSFIVFSLLPLTEAILSDLQGSFSILFHHISFFVVIIIICIYIYIHTHSLTPLLYIYVYFKHSLFSFFLFDYSRTWLSILSNLSYLRIEHARFWTTSCFFGDIQVLFMHINVRKIQLLLVEKAFCALWTCACMMN